MVIGPAAVAAFGPLEATVAACAVSHGAALWTLNRKDFEGIPGFTLA